jgi:DNA-binding beta-propeller fold protein YncE
MALLLAAACQNPVSDGPVEPPTGSVSIAVTTMASDWSAANFEIVSADDYTLRPNLIDGLHTDLAVRAFGTSVFILERGGRDNIVKYDAGTMAVAYQQNLGTGLNIHDIAVISATKAYVSSYEDNYLIIFDPTAGMSISTIDLSQFVAYFGTDSAQAYPYVSALARHGNYVYAACQRLKIGQTPWGAGPVPGDTSLIVIIDTRDNAVVGEIKLNKRNPAAMSIHGNIMLVASNGDWFDQAATPSGVEMIDLSSNVNLGVIASGEQFGGIVSNVQFVSADKAYAGVTDDSFNVGVFPFNPVTKEVGTRISGIEDGFGGLAFDGQRLYVGDRGFSSSGIAVVNPSTDTVERHIQTSMPPSALAIINRE